MAFTKYMILRVDPQFTAIREGVNDDDESYQINHVLSVGPNNTTNSAVDFVCEKCNQSFPTVRNKKEHVRKFHPDMGSIPPPTPVSVKSADNTDSKPYMCDVCKKRFTHKITYNRHLKKMHDLVTVKDCNLNKKCPLCSFALSAGTQDTEMFRHFHEVHDILIIENELEFQSIEEFQIWLQQEEKDTKSRYIKRNSRKFHHEIQISYKCHRSGYYNPKGQGRRVLPRRGSVKMNAFCPAGIRLINDQTTGHCKIRYICTHVGHSAEGGVDYLWLSKDDRQEIANKILSGVPYDVILSEYNSRISDGADIDRVLKRRDLNNLKRKLVETGHNITIDSNIDISKEQDANKNFNRKRKAVKTLEEEKDVLKKYLISLVDSVDSPEKLEEITATLGPLFSMFPSVVVNGPLDVQFFY